MAEIFNLPAVGDTMVEGEIVEWFVAVGDTVELDQTICSLETDKSVVEMTTPFRGTVLQLGGDVGAMIEVGTPLIIVGEPGETFDAPSAAEPATSASAFTSAVAEPVAAVPVAATASASAPAAGGWTPSPIVRKLAESNNVDLKQIVGSGVGGRITRADVEAAIAVTAPGSSGPAKTNGHQPVLAMPKVRKMAREQSIDLTALRGSGPRGSITFADLEARALGATASTKAPRSDRRERLSAMRRSIAAHLTESTQTIPQFTSMVEVDATAVLATRKALATRIGQPIPIDAVLMSLMIPVLVDHPVINAALEGDEVVYYGEFNIGVAVDTPDGLMVPVVKHADRLGFAELAAEILRLATAARERTIQPHELAGATCTVNNVGSLGVLQGTPILPLGTSTIVAFGLARPVVQLHNGNAVEVPTMTISATFDHRLVDGGDSGRFLAQLKTHLEVPALGLLATI